jgi:hypothetical protein
MNYNAHYIIWIFLFVVSCVSKPTPKFFAKEYCECVNKVKKEDPSIDLKTIAMICNYQMAKKDNEFLKLFFIHKRYPEIHNKLIETIDSDDYRQFIGTYVKTIEDSCKCGLLSL